VFLGEGVSEVASGRVQAASEGALLVRRQGRHAEGELEEWAAIGGRPGFDEQHPRPGGGGQPSSQSAARCAGTDYDVVGLAGGHE
jgi:hypothetical protein